MPENFKCNIVVPMAGYGKRFQDAGFVIPKPYIDIFGSLMFQIAFESIGFIGDRNIFIANKEHIKYRDIEVFIEEHITSSQVIFEENPTGQANSVLKAGRIINNSVPLFVCNCDHKIIWDQNDFLFRLKEENIDGCILTFYSDDPNPKYSYVKVNDETGKIIEVAEKIKISNFATAGIYYFSKGSDFVKYTKKMVRENKSTNGEFYVAPVFNEMIADGKNIINILCHKMISFGTPEELKKYLWSRG